MNVSTQRQEHGRWFSFIMMADLTDDDPGQSGFHIMQLIAQAAILSATNGRVRVLLTLVIEADQFERALGKTSFSYVLRTGLNVPVNEDDDDAYAVSVLWVTPTETSPEEC